MSPVLRLTHQGDQEHDSALESLDLEPPQSWQGLALEWHEGARALPVYLGSFATSSQKSPATAHLLGIRYDLERARSGGSALGHGFFVEYLILRTAADGQHKLQRLVQQGSVTYSPLAEAKDYRRCAALRSGDTQWLHHRPRWESPADAVWPTLAGKLMAFVGQITLPDTPTTRKHLTWGVTVYLFVGRDGDDSLFKVVEQEVGEQSAVQHYAHEEQQREPT